MHVRQEIPHPRRIAADSFALLGLAFSVALAVGIVLSALVLLLAVRAEASAAPTIQSGEARPGTQPLLRRHA